MAIQNCTFNLGLYTIADRLLDTAAIDLSEVTGNVTVENNQISGSGQDGIGLSDIQGYQIVVQDNNISMLSLVTNGYGILTNAIENFTIAGNTIISQQNTPSLQQTSGSRGILIDGYEGLTEDGNIYGNYVDVWESDNREYLSGQAARALNLRNSVGTGIHTNIWVHDNTLIATTGPGLASEAFGMRISYDNNGPAMNNAGIVDPGQCHRGHHGRPDPQPPTHFIWTAPTRASTPRLSAIPSRAIIPRCRFALLRGRTSTARNSFPIRS